MYRVELLHREIPVVITGNGFAVWISALVVTWSLDSFTKTHIFEYPLVTQKITYQNLATAVRPSKTNSYFPFFSGTQVASVLIEHGE